MKRLCAVMLLVAVLFSAVSGCRRGSSEPRPALPVTDADRVTPATTKDMADLLPIKPKS